MKKISIFLLTTLLLITLISADLCKDENGYYKDCNLIKTKESSDTIYLTHPKDTYNNCLNTCNKKHYYCFSNKRCYYRDKCYDKCKEKHHYTETKERIINIEDTINHYTETYENTLTIQENYEDYEREDTQEIIYLDQYNYEYEKSIGYNYNKEQVVIYLPPTNYQTPEKEETIIYLDGSEWRYKEPYITDDYKVCICKRWDSQKCLRWKCEDKIYSHYYYQPRQNHLGGFSWMW